MSLYGALFGGVSGLRAQSSKIGAISDNIANVNTVGYKQSTATFQTLVVNSAGGSGTYQTGGVRGGTVMNVSKQGLLTSTESATDLAISGAGFFVVRRSAEFVTGDTTATPYYTRAGSFTQDALGNFRNAQGFYLQGWPLDREGRLPGEVGNLNQTSSSNFDSLETVNVESASGVANSTTLIEVGANLKSSQAVYPGQAATLRPDVNSSNNRDLAADQIIVGSDFSLDNGTSVNDVRRGDSFSITAGATTGQPYVYGGYTIGRQVTSPGGSGNYGDFGTDNTAIFASDAGTNVTLNVAGSIDITIPNHGLITGDRVDLTGFSSAIGATPTVQLNATHVITRIDANTIRITPATAHGVGGLPTGVPADSFNADIRVYQGNIFDAVTSTGAFLAQTGTAGFSANALTFSITTPTGGAKVFKYSATSPNTASGEFNSLTTLATAINAQQGLTARVVDGRLVVSADDANESVTFANGDAVGNSTQRGIDWVGELDMKNIETGIRRFNTLAGLAALVTADPLVSATVNNPLLSSTLDIRVDDPLSTIQFQDAIALTTAITAGAAASFPDGPGTYAAGSSIRLQITDAPPASLNVGDFVTFADLPNGLGGLPGAAPNGGPWQVTSVAPGGPYEVTMTFPFDVTIGAGPFTTGPIGRMAVQGESNHGSLLAQLGLVNSLNGVDYLTPTLGGPQQTNVLGPQYDPSGTIGDNMASGDIVAQFSRNIRIYDALGSGHDVRYSFIKTAQNTWALEVHMIPASDITPQAGLVNGQIATGSVTFNGDGTLASVSPSLQGAINVLWTNGSVPSAIELDFGTAGFPFGTPGEDRIGLSDGLSQFDSAYNVNFANQNGAPVGQLVSVSITEEGVVVASYSNGETQNLYKLPLADFPNPDGLAAQSGNIFSQTRDSGEVNLREAGTNGTGTFVSAALEASNVDLAEQLTDMIVAQRAYQANTKVIKTSDELLEQLNQI